jgi:hypothetical protein
MIASAANDGIIAMGHGDLFQISSPQRGERTKVRGFHPHPILLPSREKGLLHRAEYRDSSLTLGMTGRRWGCGW